MGVCFGGRVAQDAVVPTDSDALEKPEVRQPLRVVPHRLDKVALVEHGKRLRDVRVLAIDEPACCCRTGGSEWTAK